MRSRIEVLPVLPLHLSQVRWDVVAVYGVSVIIGIAFWSVAISYAWELLF
jgi:hypothetical protein